MSNKFIKSLTGSDSSIKEQRAILIGAQAENAQATLLINLRKEVSGLQLQIDKMSDLGPEATTDLRVGKEFNADTWVRDLQNLKISLLNRQVELETAEATYDEWFAAESYATIRKRAERQVKKEVADKNTPQPKRVYKKRGTAKPKA